MTLEERVAALEATVAELRQLLSPAKQSSNLKYTESFDRWWLGYRRTPIMSKAETFKAWKKELTVTDEITLFHGLAGYNMWLAKHPEHPVAHAVTFIRQKRYEAFAQIESLGTTDTLVVKRGEPEHEQWIRYYVAQGKFKNPNAPFLDKLTVPSLLPPAEQLL